VKRGEVWWADLGSPRGSQPAFRRPVIVVQEDLVTSSNLGTVLVVPLTANLTRARAVGNVLLEARDTGLDQPSVAQVALLTAIDKGFFEERVGLLSPRALKGLAAGLRFVLDLED
jgi:mRNA interferase MazF